MARSLIKALLLIAPLLFGQWLSSAHAGEHSTSSDDVECALCVHLHKICRAALPAPLHAAFERIRQIFIAAEHALTAAVSVPRLSIRGPPPQAL
ncbi:MAG: hypothetical protein ACT4PZ_04750 [Panacagrimonas sp.]